MSAPQETIWHIEPHTEVKHRILRDWWNGWLPILASRHRRVIYLDAFAGPGVYSDGEPGSPIVALKAALDHVLRTRLDRRECVFYYIEKRADRLARLRSEVEALRPRMPRTWSVESVQSTFEESLDAAISELEKAGATLAPTFAFVDPFGFKDIPMDLVSKILGYKWCDLLITFNARDIGRFAESPFHIDGIDRCLGGSDWHKSLPETLDERREFFLRTYEKELRFRVPEAHVRSFEVAGPKGTIYYLVGATKHRDGVRVMKRAMWKADPTGRYQFSDRTAGIKTLLEWADNDYASGVAAQGVYAHFAGKTVSVEEVEDFVLFQTPWEFKRKPILGYLTAGGKLLPAEGARKGAWPPGCQLVFAPNGLGVHTTKSPANGGPSIQS